MPRRKGTPRPPQPNSDSDDAIQFYAGILKVLNGSGIPFLVGGAYAVNALTGVNRITKDVDVFCLPSDYPRLLNACAAEGYEAEVEDERWIAKARKGDFFCDIIFGSANAINPVTHEWFDEAHKAEVLGQEVRLLPPAELIWSKAFIMDRTRFDGNDVAHVFLRCHHRINWRRLLVYMDQHWEVLFIHLLRFRYVYPSERHTVPDWVMDELLSRLDQQRKVPTPRTKVCRGRVFSRDDYYIDIAEWGFADVVGDDKHP
jgi:hypothetical protein